MFTNFINRLNNTDNLPLENRVFNAVTLCAGSAGLLISISDIILGLGMEIICFSSGTTIMLYAMHILGRRAGAYKKLVWPLLLMSLAGIINTWYVGGGMHGSVLTLLITTAIVFPAISIGQSRLYGLLIIAVISVILFILEIMYPDLPKHFDDPRKVTVDNFLTAFFFGLGLSALIIILINNYKQEQAKVAEKNHQLEAALNEVKTLRGILPICASCKKIRDDKGYWSQIESYIGKHTDAQFSHSICPECTEKLYPDIYNKIGKKN